MKLLRGNIVWTGQNNILHKYTYLSEDIECEVAVIGCGVTGAICGHYLTEAGINTVMVDKYLIGYGSTSGSTSILQYEVDYDLVQLEKMVGAQKALKSFQLCEKAVYDLANIIGELEDKCGFQLRDSLYFSDKKSDLESIRTEYYARKANGFQVEFLDQQTAKERFSFPLEAGIYSTRGAGEIDPYRFTHALIAKGVEKGLQVYENTEVTKIRNEADGVSLKIKNGKTIKAKKVVIATGYEGVKYVREKIANLNRTYTIVTKPVENFNGWHNRCLIRTSSTPYTYLRTTDDNRIIIGGEDSGLISLTDLDVVAKRKYRSLLNNLQSMFSQISNLEVEYQFSGIFAETKDGLPYIGEHKDWPNCYFSLGYGSNGVLYGILGGQLIRDLYLGQPSPDLELFKFGR